MNKVFLAKLAVWFSLAVPYTVLVCLTIPPFFTAKTSCRKPPAQAAEQDKQPAMPDLRQLAALASGGVTAVPTPQQLEEGKQVEAEQVALAKQWLDDPDLELRVMGAEQLSAYPTDDASRYLVNALKNDPEPEVKVAAAESLGYFHQPKADIFEVLLAALSDGDEDVRSSAFNSLQILLNRISDQPKAIRYFHGKLKHLLKNRLLATDMRESIQAYLLDQDVP